MIIQIASLLIFLVSISAFQAPKSIIKTGSTLKSLGFDSVIPIDKIPETFTRPSDNKQGMRVKFEQLIRNAQVTNFVLFYYLFI